MLSTIRQQSSRLPPILMRGHHPASWVAIVLLTVCATRWLVYGTALPRLLLTPHSALYRHHASSRVLYMLVAVSVSVMTFTQCTDGLEAVPEPSNNEDATHRRDLGSRRLAAGHS